MSADRWALLRVVTPLGVRQPFVAGFLWDPIEDRVVFTAPILRRSLLGKCAAEVQQICKRSGWQLSNVIS